MSGRKANVAKPGAPGSGRRTFENRDEMVAQANSMKARGHTPEDIAVELGVSISSVTVWTRGTKRPSKVAKKKLAKKLRSDAKIQLLADREKNRLLLDNQVNPTTRTLAMPTVTAAFSTKGPDIDRRVISRALTLFDTWIADRSAGRLVTVTPVERAKATIVLASSFDVVSWESFAMNRHIWKSVRVLAGLNVEDIADRTDISFASVSRYEKASRSPDASVARRLHEVYVAVQEEAITNAEWILIVASYAQAHDISDDDEIDPDDLLGWIAQGKDLDDHDIAHITHLAHVRKLLPYPRWRDPSAHNLYLSGFGNQPAKVTA